MKVGTRVFVKKRPQDRGKIEFVYEDGRAFVRFPEVDCQCLDFAFLLLEEIAEDTPQNRFLYGIAR